MCDSKNEELEHPAAEAHLFVASRGGGGNESYSQIRRKCNPSVLMLSICPMQAANTGAIRRSAGALRQARVARTLERSASKACCRLLPLVSTEMSAFE